MTTNMESFRLYSIFGNFNLKLKKIFFYYFKSTWHFQFDFGDLGVSANRKAEFLFTFVISLILTQIMLWTLTTGCKFIKKINLKLGIKILLALVL